MFDIEANNWIKFEMIGFYDGKDYWQFNSMKEFCDHVFTRRYRSHHIFGHYAGKYDDLFLLDYLQRTVERLDFSTITQGSKIISLKIKKHQHNYTFADSSAIFPNLSLKKLTESFNVTHKKLSGSIDFKTEKVNKNNPTHQKYLENDCKGLYEVIESYLKNPKVAEEGFNITAASQAMNMWRRTLKRAIQVTPQSIQNFVRQGYSGGRTEIFKMRGEDLNYYDVNSLYPFVMRNNRFPLEFNRESRVLGNALGYFECTVSSPDNYIPILPHRLEKKLLFPNGTFRGVFFSEELKLALEHGYTIEKIHKGVEFTESSDLFSEYIDYWFEVKKLAVKGSSQELIAKLFLNSLYGKFGQKEERLTLKTLEYETTYYPFHSQEVFERTGLIEVPKFHRAPYMLSHIAGAVTAYGRIHMARTCYLASPGACYYTDTDSIFTDKRMACGEAIGDLKLEKINGESGSGISASFLLPKAYYLEKYGERLESKVKGFSKEFIKTVSRKDFEALNFKENKETPCTLRTSLIRNKSYLSKIGITKSIKARYSKRRVLKNGDTEPWVFKNGVIINN